MTKLVDSTTTVLLPELIEKLQADEKLTYKTYAMFYDKWLSTGIL